jgi:hypothetical protein
MKGVMRASYRASIGKPTKEELTVTLERLAVCCREPDGHAKGATDLAEAMKQFTFWPTSDLLQPLKDSVTRLVRIERVKPPHPLWKAFLLVDKQTRSLKLVLRVNNLVKRARARLTEAGRSGLEELLWEDRKDARNLLRDIERVRQSLSAAKTIDWAQHERALLRFSPARSVELASGKNAASLEARCYARALELIVDHDKSERERLRRDSEPLVRWLAEIRHPMAKDLGAFNHKAVLAVEDHRRLVDLIKTRQKREAARKRDRRYRARKKIPCRKNVVS